MIHDYDSLINESERKKTQPFLLSTTRENENNDTWQFLNYCVTWVRKNLNSRFI